MGRLLDRYVLRTLVPLYLAAVAGFVLFFIIFDAFERVDVFVDHKTPLPLIFQFYAAGSVYNAVLVSPIALLLAIFLVFGQMTRFNEITAMKTAGLSLYRIFLPVFLLALAVSAGAWWIGESVMPGANRVRRTIYNEQIRGRLPRVAGIRMNLNYLGQGGRVYAIRRFDVRASRLEEVVVQEFTGTELTRRIDARRADWNGWHWVFRNGIDRRFTGDAESATPFDSLSAVDCAEAPADMARDEAEPNQMDSKELGVFIQRLGQSGRPTCKYETERYLKIAYPLVNLMVALLAAPLATRLRRGGIAIGFGLSFALFITYIGLVRLGQVLGHAGAVPPAPAAWMGNVLYGAAGLVLLWKTPK